MWAALPGARMVDSNGRTQARAWGRFVGRELLGSTAVGIAVAIGTVTVPVAVTRSVSEALFFLPYASFFGGVVGLAVGITASLLSGAGLVLTRRASLRVRLVVIGVCGALGAVPLIPLASLTLVPVATMAGAIALCGLIAGGLSSGNAYLALRSRPHAIQPRE